MSLASGDVFIRTSTRRNSAGVPVRYLQLVHNTWGPVARVTKAKVLHSFGREDEVDRAGIEHCPASLTRLLDPTPGLGGPPAGPRPGLSIPPRLVIARRRGRAGREGLDDGRPAPLPAPAA